MLLLKNIILAPFNKGQRKQGVENSYCLLNLLLNLFGDKIGKYESYIGVVKQNTSLISNDQQVIEYCNTLYNKLKTIECPILLGGDHSIGQASVASSLAKVNSASNLVVIWLDAHADINTFDASLTKNYHGMPLAGIVGIEKGWIDMTKILPFENLLYYGIRDLDKFEEDLIKEKNIFNTRNIKTMLDKIDLIMKSNPDVKFHISFDVDSLDPSIMSSTGVMAPDGVYPEEVVSIINHIGNKIIALDIVEFNSQLGDKEHSLETMAKIFKNIF